ncbi:hypothetical protein D3C81_334940 [compost metagenome]
MSKVIDFAAFNDRKAEATAAAKREYLKGFAKKVADMTFVPGFMYPLAGQSICAGWHGYLDMPQCTDWWLPAVVPVQPDNGKMSWEIEFYNCRLPQKDNVFPLVGKIEVFPSRQPVPKTDVDGLTILEKCINEYGDGANNPALPFHCIMFFAQKDMGFKYDGHTVNGMSVTIALQALTERMEVTFHAEQCIVLLDYLKLTIERFNRRDGKAIEVEWPEPKPTE